MISREPPLRRPTCRALALACLRYVLAIGAAVCLTAALLAPGRGLGREAAEDGAGAAERGPSIVVFSRAGCPYCTRAKALLRKRRVPFAVVDLDLEPRRRAQAAELSGASTVPQIFVGQRCLGGYDDIQRLDDAGELLAALQRRSGDGRSISPTPARLLAGHTAVVPDATIAALAPTAARLRVLRYDAGAQPTLRAFFKYAMTGKPAQGQDGNVPLNLAGNPEDEALKAVPPALPKVGALELAGLLRLAMARLLDSFADPETGEVDYVEMKASTDWLVFLALASELSSRRLRADLGFMGEAARKAFFINLYNAMTFHGIVRYGRRPGAWGLYCFFVAPAVSYDVAGYQLSLDDVENGLLRARPGYFEDEAQDFLRELRLFEVDPRVHMALNCGARGCPTVGVYSAEGLEEELEGAARSFVADDSRVLVMKVGRRSSRLALTELFRMYLEDFAGPGARLGSPETSRALVRWLAKYARGRKLLQLSSMLGPGAPPVRIRWLPYDWRTNGPDMPLDKRIYTPVW